MGTQERVGALTRWGRGLGWFQAIFEGGTLGFANVVDVVGEGQSRG